MSKARLIHRAGKQVWGCCDSVFSPGSYTSHSCSNVAKYDPDPNGNPTKCGIHSDDAMARRREKSEANYRMHAARSTQEARNRKLGEEAIKIVREIAKGHNDPRGLADDWVKRRDA